MHAPIHPARFDDGDARPAPEIAGPAVGRVEAPKRRSALRWIHTAVQREAVVGFRARRYRDMYGLGDAFRLPYDRFDERGLISSWSDGQVVGCVTTNQMRIREFPDRSIYERFIPVSIARRMAAIARPDDTIREFARLTGEPRKPGSAATILRHLLRQSPPTFMLIAALSPERLASYGRLGGVMNFMPLGDSFHGAEEFHGHPTLFQILYRTHGATRRAPRICA